MPLRDHFRSPVNNTHSWDEVHGQWPGEIVRDLAKILPAGFRAAPKVHLGSPFEVDVSTYDLDSNGGGTALAPTFVAEANLTESDEYEVRITDTERMLVAVIKIVSVSNCRLFVGKVASLLQQNVCVLLVDLVSVRQANLYAELLTFLGCTDPQLTATPPHMYAVALRFRKRLKRRPLLDAWFYPMIVGQPLPTLPIWLTPEQHVTLPLETSYEETCSVLGIA